MKPLKFQFATRIKPKALILLKGMLILSPLLMTTCLKKPPWYDRPLHIYCFVNGQYWYPHTPGGLNSAQELITEYYAPKKAFGIQATVEDNGVLQGMYIVAENITGPGTYNMIVQEQSVSAFTDYYPPAECGIWYIEQAYPATITFTTFDTIEGRAKGSFQMVLHNGDCNDSMRYITGGRFNLTF